MRFIRTIIDSFRRPLVWVTRALFRLFSGFKHLGSVLFLVRVSLVASIIAVVVWRMPQGTEAMFSIFENKGNFPTRFILFTGYFNVLVWLWARALTDLKYNGLMENKNVESRFFGSDTEKEKFIVANVPRLISVLPSFAAVYTAKQVTDLAGGDAKWLPLISVALSFIVLAGVIWYRRPLDARFRKWLAKIPSVLTVYEFLFDPRPPVITGGRHHSLTTTFLLVFAPLIVTGFLIAGLWHPATIGTWAGPAGAFFLAASFIVALLNSFVYYFFIIVHEEGFSQRYPRFRVPVFTLSVLAVLLVPMIAKPFAVARYEIRKLNADVAKPQVINRDTLDEAINKWDADNKKTAQNEQNRQIVIVATAGGALRAAYWTGTILGHLRENVPKFDDKLFAISGVSGGAFGATAYVAATQAHKVRKGTKGFVQNRLSDDYLGPVALGLIANDVALLPLSVFVGQNRAYALETAWENSWDKDKNPMSSDFLKLWSGKDRPFPILLLNGTIQESGNQVITSNVNVTGAFTETFDFFDLHPYRIRASTAVHNSARFSYISPAGRVLRDGKEPFHVIDGGYFENYGAEVALQLAQKVRQKYADSEIFIIQIVSDPAFNRSVLEPGGDPKKPISIDDRLRETIRFGQYLAPLQGLLITRESRGIHAARRLQSWARKDGKGGYFLFNMSLVKAKSKLDKTKGDPQPALSWFMPELMRTSIKELIKNPKYKEAHEMAELIKALRCPNRSSPGCKD